MKLIVNERNDCCESIHAEYTPAEALVINQAMRRYACDDDVLDENKTIMKQMLNVKPIILHEQKTGQWLYGTYIQTDGYYYAECSECHTIRIVGKYCPHCGAKMIGSKKSEV